jgi:hypothetical protein
MSTESNQDKSYGKVAYEAYCASTNWSGMPTIPTLPQWKDQPYDIRDAWEKAAIAVIKDFQMR